MREQKCKGGVSAMTWVVASSGSQPPVPGLVGFHSSLCPWPGRSSTICCGVQPGCFLRGILLSRSCPGWDRGEEVACGGREGGRRCLGAEALGSVLLGRGALVVARAEGGLVSHRELHFEIETQDHQFF